MSSDSDFVSFSVLSLNCWGIPYVTKNYKSRITAISDRLFEEPKFDVICLQEIWVKSDFALFQIKAKNSYPFSHYFYSGVLGSGVCIFSKWPITDVLFHKWQVNGYIHKVTHGDWYGGKGIGLCRLKVNDFKINIYTCHTHAVYNKDTEYIAHRVVQSYDIAQFIRISSEGADLAILAADLNTEPEDLCFQIINSYAGLNDAFNAKINTADSKGTYGCSRNSYSCFEDRIVSCDGQRIDYILYKSGKKVLVECELYCMPLEMRINDQEYSYSDHEAISASFKLQKRMNLQGNKDFARNKNILETSMKEAIWICDKAVKKLEKDLHNIKYAMFIVLIILTMLFAGLINCFYYLPLGQSIIAFVIVYFVIVSVILFVSKMIYIWKRIELNGILCALSGMKIIFNLEY